MGLEPTTLEFHAFPLSQEVIWMLLKDFSTAANKTGSGKMATKKPLKKKKITNLKD